MEGLNELAKITMQNLSEHNYFFDLPALEEQMRDNPDPFNKRFYSAIQDKISQINGEFITAYFQLRAELKTYLAVRKSQMKLEAETKGGKLAGNEILESLCYAEVSDLYKAVIIIEGWQARADSALKTARNHTYSEKEVDNNEKQESI